MFIILSSFAQVRPLRQAMRHNNVAVLSVASYAPRDFNPERSIPEFAPLNPDGSRFRIRDHGTPDDFYWAMHDRLQKVGVDGLRKLSKLMEAGVNGVVLCCWCPGTTTARKQLREHKSFVCHTEPLGFWLQGRGFQVLETRTNLYHTPSD